MTEFSPIIEILHVDDEEHFLELTKIYLEENLNKNYSFHVETVSNPVNVIEMLSKKKYDVLLSDYQMPSLDGLKLYKKIQEKDIQIPFIIFTGKGREEIVIKALNLGVDGYITKGSDVESQYQELAHSIISIVKYKRTEEALHLSESKTQAMLNAIPDLLLTFDEKGTILSYKGDLQDFIVKPEEFLGHPVAKILPEQLGNQFVEYIDKTLSTKEFQSFGYQIPIRGEIRFREARMFASTSSEVVCIIRDETEKKKIEAMLVESELNYKATLDAIIEPIHVIDKNFKFTLLNKACEEWNKKLGVKVNVINKSIFDIYPFLAEKALEEYNSVLKTHDVVITEELIELMGESFYSETIKIPIIENLEVTKIITYIKDITDRKNIELQLKDKEIRYRTMFEESPIALREEDYTEAFEYLDALKNSGVTNLREFLSKEENFKELQKCANLVKVLEINKADLKLFNAKSKEEIIGNLTKKFSPQTYTTFREGILAIYQGENAYNSEIMILTNSGEERYAKLNLILIPTGNKTIKALTSLIDITDNIEIEKKLIESFDEYHFLFENSPVSLWSEDFSEFKNYIDLLKSEGITNFREYFEKYPKEVNKCVSLITIDDVNKTTLKMFNLKSKSAVIGSADKLMDENSFNSFKEEFISFAEGKAEFTSQNIKIVTEEGTQYFNLRSVIPDGYKETFEKVLVSCTDITDLRKIENELLKQRTELSEFAHFMAHDLNNSINVISGFIELLKQDYKPEYLDKIQKNALNMSNILNKSLLLADAGLVIDKTENVNLNSLMKSNADSLITQDINYTQDELPTIFGDKEKIHQIFANILENAISHGKPSKIAIKYTLYKKKHKILIQNDGSPIPKEFINKIFIRGFSTKHSTGLGLAIVKNLVEAHGWEISVKSDQNLTSFDISIPILNN
ncbi:MAG: Sporulation kinase A [Candidatus Heimdallarchaeota archaeon LC_3]|nr:MAG: Sporulation kinase A [Candidatus Heimdallarchaeota archaeon LC_3]